MDKQLFIGKYLEKKLKNCKLPYGMQYISLLASLTDKAEKLWNKKQNKMDLRLSLKKKWFDLTKAGIKLEDYREITPYWVKRLLFNGKIEKEMMNMVIEDMVRYYLKSSWQPNFKQFTTNTMTLGYPSNSDKERIITFEHNGIEIGYGKEEWGAEPNKLYFIIKHGGIK